MAKSRYFWFETEDINQKGHIISKNSGHGLEKQVSWESNLLRPLLETFKGPFLAKNRKKWNYSSFLKKIEINCLFEAQNDKLESVECLFGKENLWGPL